MMDSLRSDRLMTWTITVEREALCKWQCSKKRCKLLFANDCRYQPKPWFVVKNKAEIVRQS